MSQNTPNNFRCGMVSIVGRPNVGKSTLLNAILGEKVSIVSKVPQTTRNQVRGIYTEKRGQIVFIDTPGLVLGKDKLDRLLKRSSMGSTQDADCIIHLVDTQDVVGKEEEEIVRRLADVKSPIVLGLNKVDLKGGYIPEYLALWEKARGVSIQQMKNFTLIALSGKEKTNLDTLLDVIFEYLPEGPALYPEDTISDVPQKMAIADIIREKFLALLRDEIPHSIAVFIESMETVKKVIHIRALILVERDSQKNIVIGKHGHILKKAGTLARKELEDILEQKVFLETYVKVKSDWRDNDGVLQDLGYDSEV